MLDIKIPFAFRFAIAAAVPENFLLLFPACFRSIHEAVLCIGGLVQEGQYC